MIGCPFLLTLAVKVYVYLNYVYILSEDTFLYMYLIVVGLDDTSLRNAAHAMLLSYKSWRDLPDQSFSGCLCAFSATCRCTSSSTDMVILGMSINAADLLLLYT